MGKYTCMNVDMWGAYPVGVLLQCRFVVECRFSKGLLLCILCQIFSLVGSAQKTTCQIGGCDGSFVFRVLVHIAQTVAVPTHSPPLAPPTSPAPPELVSVLSKYTS